MSPSFVAPVVTLPNPKGIKGRQSPTSQVQTFQTQRIPSIASDIRPDRYNPSQPGPANTILSNNPQIAALQNRIRSHREWGSNTHDLIMRAIEGKKSRESQARLQRMSYQRQQEPVGFTDFSDQPSGPIKNDHPLARQLAARAGGRRGQILNATVDMFGTPYAWGGGGIGVRASRGIGKGTENVIGVDCSGLTSYVYGRFGIRLPRWSNHQTTVGVRTNIANAKPGDLVGWARGGHVAIYAGNGYIFHSARPGTVVGMRKLFNGEKVYAVSLNIPDAARPTSTARPMSTRSSGSKAGANAVNNYLAALRRQESSNNYRARSKYSTASGAYQYTNSTWNNYGGYSRAYLAPPAVQDRRAREDAIRKFQRYGNWETVAASHLYPAWATNRAMWNRRPGGSFNPTVADYVARIMSYM